MNKTEYKKALEIHGSLVKIKLLIQELADDIENLESHMYSSLIEQSYQSGHKGMLRSMNAKTPR